MTLRAGLLALAIGTTVLAACSRPDAVPPSSSGSLTRLSATIAAPSSGGSKAGSDKAPATTESEAPEALAELVSFTSPSGNVGCVLDPSMVRCDIGERTWAPPPRPTDCEFDYGQGIGLTTGEAPAFVCAGDTTLGGGEPLDYGASLSAGPLQCSSAESGITCRDSTTGHGFTIAREAFRLF